MRRGLPKRPFTAAPPCLDQLDTKALPETTIEAMISAGKGGLATRLVRVPSDGAIAIPDSGQGAGRFYIVRSGWVFLGDKRCTRLANIFNSADQDGFTILAGLDGVEAVVVQFPVCAVNT